LEKLPYRPELDGLRAVAVLAVLINHAAPKALTGGYLGVDIFFVLSGYVVTRSQAITTNSPLNFYQRRIKRLQPALVLVIVSCGLLATVCGYLNWASLTTGASSLLGFANITLLLNSQD